MSDSLLSQGANLSNEEIDRVVSGAISTNYDRAALIQKRIREQGYEIEGDLMRVVDRSLQRLRKRGEIELVASNRWRVK